MFCAYADNSADDSVGINYYSLFSGSHDWPDDGLPHPNDLDLPSPHSKAVLALSAVPLAIGLLRYLATFSRDFGRHTLMVFAMTLELGYVLGLLFYVVYGIFLRFYFLHQKIYCCLRVLCAGICNYVPLSISISSHQQLLLYHQLLLMGLDTNHLIRRNSRC